VAGESAAGSSELTMRQGEHDSYQSKPSGIPEVALASAVIPAIPVAGMALILGIDRFMSMFRALVNMIGNGVATLVVARWENELDRQTLQTRLA